MAQDKTGAHVSILECSSRSSGLLTVRNAILTLTLSQGNRGVRCRLALEKDSKSLTAEFSFLSPVQPTDADDVRWLIEEHPRLHGHAADTIAARIEGRLEELGAELRSSLFESSSDAA